MQLQAWQAISVGVTTLSSVCCSSSPAAALYVLIICSQPGVVGAVLCLCALSKVCAMLLVICCSLRSLTGCMQQFLICCAAAGRNLSADKQIQAVFRSFDSCSLPLMSLVEVLVAATGAAVVVEGLLVALSSCSIDAVSCEELGR